MAAIPAAGGHIPLPSRRHMLELGYEYKTDYDYGHVPTAWYNLGLHTQAAVPNQVRFEDYCTRLINAVRDLNARKRASRSRRFRLIVMAIKTISGQGRAEMNPNNPDRDFPLAGDLPFQRTWVGTMAGITPLPLPAAEIAQIRSRTPAQAEARRQRKLRYRQTQDIGGLSARERMHKQQQIRMSEWEYANRCSSFQALNSMGIQTLVPITTYKEDDNSLWHALSYQVNGPGIGAGDSARTGLRGGRREKAWLYHYFTSVLHDPTHIRHRLYTRLQEDSRSILRPGHNPTTTAQMPDWGELSVLRVLAVNNKHGGVPKWPQFAGIFQLIADFWRKEVIVFHGTRGLLPNGWRAPYRMWIFGKREYGLGREYPEHGQLYFVTDETMQHFDAVEQPDPVGRPDIFDTSHMDENDRYGWLDMPFLDVAGFVPPVSRAPTDIPVTDNGVPVGTPGRETYSRPASDPQYRLRDDHPLVVCYEHDRDVIETRPGFGDGKMPRLANMLTMGAWTTEQGAPGVDVRPTVFEPWLMTSGCFRIQANPIPIRQGAYENKIAALYADYRLRLEGKTVKRPFTFQEAP